MSNSKGPIDLTTEKDKQNKCLRLETKTKKRFVARDKEAYLEAFLRFLTGYF